MKIKILTIIKPVREEILRAHWLVRHSNFGNSRTMPYYKRGQIEKVEGKIYIYKGVSNSLTLIGINSSAVILVNQILRKWGFYLFSTLYSSCFAFLIFLLQTSFWKSLRNKQKRPNDFERWWKSPGDTLILPFLGARPLLTSAIWNSLSWAQQSFGRMPLFVGYLFTNLLF